MKEFEYKIVKDDEEVTHEAFISGGVEGMLSSYGLEGWELVGVTIEKGGQGIGSKTRVYFLKRETK